MRPKMIKCRSCLLFSALNFCPSNIGKFALRFRFCISSLDRPKLLFNHKDWVLAQMARKLFH